MYDYKSNTVSTIFKHSAYEWETNNVIKSIMDNLAWGFLLQRDLAKKLMVVEELIALGISIVHTLAESII